MPERDIIDSHQEFVGGKVGQGVASWGAHAEQAAFRVPAVPARMDAPRLARKPCLGHVGAPSDLPVNFPDGHAAKPPVKQAVNRAAPALAVLLVVAFHAVPGPFGKVFQVFPPFRVLDGPHQVAHGIFQFRDIFDEAGPRPTHQVV